MVEEDILSTAERILTYGPICDNCLGRQFAKLSGGLTNRERGHAIRTVLRMIHDDRTQPPQGCWVCLGLFEDSELSRWADMIEEALRGVECRTFLIGTRMSGLLAENEETLWGKSGARHAEPLKSELNREVGKIVSERMGLEVEFKHPDVLLILDLPRNKVDLRINPVFVFGRYLKLVRGIPQTRWPCRRCHGKGCERCNFTGKLYKESVEELIGEVAVRLFDGEGYTFHGAGREDIDARMLGSGRPFILEIKSPKVRRIDLKMLEEGVDQEKVQLLDLRYIDGSKVEVIKSASPWKRYRVRVRLGSSDKKRLETALKEISGRIIEQRTPTRVLHRRADIVRRRRVIDARLIRVEDGSAIIEILSDSGLYVKELISGDDGRTMPNLSMIMGEDLAVEELDVIEVGKIKGVEIQE
ncbi:MAG TPA: tRNA pseudouridine(54/55) synthase Pus10 [Candidatus Syntrophoarchaeum butanivorans]|uniref:tRNA pseudouridine synthase Pus10 n=1 Tax=Candidatus Syntropharchaeum butanivorans TaxID=1839936 RepID=A0A7C0X199_9EURY|nr:tRNA pseudouridine(54/55) synthase Pus10 [Candidatus Syntrophoarchaeum butanivorans]